MISIISPYFIVMKLLTLTGLFICSTLTHAVESVTATVDSVVLKNDSVFPSSLAYYKASTSGLSNNVNSGFFLLDVKTSYIQKSTGPISSDVFRVRVQLLGANDTVIPLAAGKTQLLTTSYDMNVSTFVPLKNKDFSLVLTPASALDPKISYKIKVSIQREDLVDAAKVWVSDPATMTKDLELFSTVIPFPTLRVSKVAGVMDLSFEASGVQQSIDWKVQSSTTLASASWTTETGIVFVRESPSNNYKTQTPLNTSTQPKRFFRLVAP
jgi:hypothetical protein